MKMPGEIPSGYHVRIDIRPSVVPYAEPEEKIVLVPTVAQEYALRKAYKVAGRGFAQALESVSPISRSQIGHRNLLSELRERAV